MHATVPPSIEQGLYNTTLSLLKGKTIQLKCPAHGLPFPNITWSKDNHPIPPNHRTRLLLSDTTLEISMAQIEDTGSYQCTALNQAGSASLKYHLLVHSAIYLL